MKNKKSGKVLACLLGIAGLALLTGGIGPKAGLGALVIKLLGTAALLGAIGIGLAVAGVIAAAVYSNKTESPHQESKNEIRQILQKQQEGLSEIKGNIRRTNLELSRIEGKIRDCDRQIADAQQAAETILLKGDEQQARLHLAEKQRLIQQRSTLEQHADLLRNSIRQMDELRAKLELEMTELESRVHNADSMLAAAAAKESALNSPQAESLREYEAHAEYEEALARAEEELEKSKMLY